MKHLSVTALVAILVFISVGYMACSKPETTPTPDKCANIDCLNGGTCFKGHCSCPGGFEGDLCQTNTILRYTGKWKVSETVTGSSTDTNWGDKRVFEVNIEQNPGTRTQFLVSNFAGNNSFNKVVCQEGKNTKYEADSYTNYVFETMQYIGQYTTIIKGSGTVNEFGTQLQGSYTTNCLRDNINIIDTVSFTASRID